MRSDNKKKPFNNTNNGKRNNGNQNQRRDGELRVACKMRPCNTIHVYNPSLADLQDSIQSRFNELTEKLRDLRDWDIDDISIDLSMANYGGYVFFGLSLPDSVLKRNRVRNDVEEIFTKQNGGSSSPQIIEPIYELLKTYIYTKEEQHDFNQPKMRRSLKCSPQQIDTIVSLMKPRIEKSTDNDGNSHKIIYLLINPIRVFHDMYTEVDENGKVIKNAPPFTVTVKSFSEIRTGNYQFIIERRTVNKRRKEVGSLNIDQLIKRNMGLKRRQDNQNNNSGTRRNNNNNNRYRRR